MSSEETTVFKTAVPPPQGPAVEVDTGRGRWRDSLLVLLWSAILAAVIFLPLLRGRGVALIGEMVFVPRQPMKEAWLGLDGGSTAAVPADFLVSLLTVVAPGDFVQKVALVAAVLLAGTGAGAAVSHLGLAPRLAAATVYVWNPWVFERLAVGDWTLVAAYAVLPWIVWAARRTVTGGVGEWVPIVVFIAFAGWLNPLGGLLALLLGVLLLVGRSARGVVVVLVAGIVVNLPTLVPALLRRGGATADPATVEAYALSDDGALGLIGNLATLSGIWDTSAAAPGRDQLLVVILALVLSAAALVGAVLLSRRAGGGIVVGVGVVAAVGVVIALLGALPGTRTALENVVESVPGGALLADGHGWLAPLALLFAVGLAGLVKEAAGRVSGAGALAAAGVVAVAAPIALLPSLAIGLDGRLELVRYPLEWWEVRQVLDEQSPAGVLVLPFAPERAFAFNEEGSTARESDDPALRYFPGDVVVDDAREIEGVAVEGNDPMIAEIRAAFGRGGDLATALSDNGIDTIVVEKQAEGDLPRLGSLEAERLHNGRQFTVLSLAAPTGEPDKPAAAVILGADVLAALVGLGALGAWIVMGRGRREEPAPELASSYPAGGSHAV